MTFSIIASTVGTSGHCDISLPYHGPEQPAQHVPPSHLSIARATGTRADGRAARLSNRPRPSRDAIAELAIWPAPPSSPRLRISRQDAGDHDTYQSGIAATPDSPDRD